MLCQIQFRKKIWRKLNGSSSINSSSNLKGRGDNQQFFFSPKFEKAKIGRFNLLAKFSVLIKIKVGRFIKKSCVIITNAKIIHIG